LALANFWRQIAKPQEVDQQCPSQSQRGAAAVLDLVLFVLLSMLNASGHAEAVWSLPRSKHTDFEINPQALQVQKNANRTMWICMRDYAKCRELQIKPGLGLSENRPPNPLVHHPHENCHD